MKLKDPATWGGVFLPKPSRVRWTLKRWLLLGVAVAMFVDSFLVPFYGPVDPGGSGAGVLFLIFGFRALSRRSLPMSVVIAGACSAVLTLALNHGILKSPSVIWTPINIFLMLVVLFWGRKSKDIEAPRSPDPDAKSVLNVSAKN